MVSRYPGTSIDYPANAWIFMGRYPGISPYPVMMGRYPDISIPGYCKCRIYTVLIILICSPLQFCILCASLGVCPRGFLLHAGISWMVCFEYFLAGRLLDELGVEYCTSHLKEVGCVAWRVWCASGDAAATAVGIFFRGHRSTSREGWCFWFGEEAIVFGVNPGYLGKRGCVRAAM